MAVNDASHHIISELLAQRTGQQLTEGRRWRVSSALSGLFRECGIENVDQLACLLERPGEHGLATRVVEALLNNETYFFRDNAYFSVLANQVLPDLARITNPCLNVIDALTGQWGREWDGEGRVCDALIAGDQIIATDAVGTHLMGHDPTSDWPTPPFRRDRNHLLIAARGGFGTVDLEEIDVVSEVEAPLNEFDSVEEDPPEHMATVRETACEQGLFYRDHQKDLIDRYRGDFVYLQETDKSTAQGIGHIFVELVRIDTADIVGFENRRIYLHPPRLFCIT